uniref:Candidate secreted effector n=1 Tax=Meloidogyne incognita TaxID=6306 RepID=A0A914KGE2_MELIC
MVQFFIQRMVLFIFFFLLTIIIILFFLLIFFSNSIKTSLPFFISSCRLKSITHSSQNFINFCLISRFNLCYLQLRLIKVFRKFFIFSPSTQ